MLTQTTVESPLLNLTGTVHWRDRWWLLDVETSGLDRQEDRLRLLPGPHCAAGAQLNGGAR